jgi:hypothetical protein
MAEESQPQTAPPFLDRASRFETVRISVVVDVELDTGKGGDTLPGLIASGMLSAAREQATRNRYVGDAVSVLSEVDGRVSLA